MRRGVFMLFAKEPTPGRVKTRLVPPLTPEEAAALYEAFVADMLVALTLAAGERIDVEIHTDPAPPDAPRLHQLENLAGPPSAGPERSAAKSPQCDGRRADCAVFHPQVGESLGERLFHAFDRARAQGRPYAIVVGADHPSLRASALAALAEAIEAGREAAIIPSEDGGYCALGLARPRWDFFAGVPWSTPGVLDATLARLRASGIEPHLLDRSADVDVPSDLERLSREIEARDPSEADFPRRTARALAARAPQAGRRLDAARSLQEPTRGPSVTGFGYPSEKGVLR
jgi:uncharacterized protein